MAERIAVCFLVDDTHVVVRESEQGVHLGEALDLVETELEADDDALALPTHDRRIKAALRALVTDVGLFSSRPARDDHVLSEVLDETDRGASLGRVLRERGLSLCFEEAAVLGRFEARGDVLGASLDVVLVRLSRACLAGPFELLLRARASIVEDWAHGRVLLSPTLAMALEAAPRTLRTAAWEVAPHLRMLPVRTPTLPPATHTNAFLVGSRELVLVEPATPYVDELDRIVAEVEALRATGHVLVAILATHHHPDHIGGALALRERLGVPLHAHAMTAKRLEGEVRFDRLLEHDARITLDGPTPMELVAVHTPGHAPGHLCFLETRSRALIAGDMVAGVGTILVETHDGDMQLYLESLRAMRDLSPSMLLPAHGGVVREPSALLDHYVAHRLAREEKVVSALVELGVSSPAGLVPKAYDDAPKAVWPLAIMSVEAHLEKLVREGRVSRRGGVFALA